MWPWVNEGKHKIIMLLLTYCLLGWSHLVCHKVTCFSFIRQTVKVIFYYSVATEVTACEISLSVMRGQSWRQVIRNKSEKTVLCKTMKIILSPPNISLPALLLSPFTCIDCWPFYLFLCCPVFASKSLHNINTQSSVWTTTNASVWNVPRNLPSYSLSLWDQYQEHTQETTTVIIKQSAFFGSIRIKKWTSSSLTSSKQAPS